MMIHELIIRNTLLHPSAVAIIEASTGAVYSYRQLHLAAAAVASALQQRRQLQLASMACQYGQQQSAAAEVVAVMLPHSFVRVAALLGCWLAGAAVVCLDQGWTGEA
jgi:acyl-CoA synthetase (AMP-forming)/AMP-acid ligase II